MKRVVSLVVLILLFGVTGKAFAQYEFEYVFDSIKNETPCALFQEIMELDNGDFILNGRDMTQYAYPCYCIYQLSPIGELIKEKLFVNDLQLAGYVLENNEGPRLLVNKNGGYYLFIIYNPIFDTINTNYVPDTFDAKIMMKKLDDDFEIEYSREMSICLDTVDWKNLWGQNASGCQAPKIVLGTVMDNDGEGFVISYEKYIGEHPQHLWEHGNDSTFFLKTDYDLNVNKIGFYEHNRCNGDKKHKNHLLYDSRDNKYIYYTASDWSLAGEKKAFTSTYSMMNSILLKKICSQIQKEQVFTHIILETRSVLQLASLSKELQTKQPFLELEHIYQLYNKIITMQLYASN